MIHARLRQVISDGHLREGEPINIVVALGAATVEVELKVQDGAVWGKFKLIPRWGKPMIWEGKLVDVPQPDTDEQANLGAAFTVPQVSGGRVA